VTPGSYTQANITVDAQGRLTAAATGSTAATFQLTGDVTGGPSTSPLATTIANDAVTTVKIADGQVTLAKMANIATDRLIGRDTTGTGVPEALTVGGGVEFTGSGGIQRSALSGDVAASAGSGTTTIGAGKVLAPMLKPAIIPDFSAATPATDDLLL